MKIKKLRRRLRELRYFLPTLYFNFHYLPFRQAIHLPIVLYKPHLLKCKGKIRIEPDNGKVYFGMIRMGQRMVSIFPNNGITLELRGGTVVFKGKCVIGGDSYVSVGPKATLEFGNHFASSAVLKLVCMQRVKFDHHVRIGWNGLVMDSNFHPLYDMEKKMYGSYCGPIEIGAYNWFGTGCKVMNRVITPERCIFGMGTTVTRGSVMQSYCLMGGSPVRVLRENVMRVFESEDELSVIK